jgi:hypothetical protein
VSFLITMVPFWWFVLRRDIPVGVLVPVLLAVSAAAAGVGLVGALIHECVRRPVPALGADFRGP